MNNIFDSISQCTMTEKEFSKLKRDLRKRSQIQDDELQQISHDYFNKMNLIQYKELTDLLFELSQHSLTLDEFMKEVKKIKSGGDFIKLANRTKYNKDELFLLCSDLISDLFYAEAFCWVYCLNTSLQETIRDSRKKYHTKALDVLLKVQRLEKDRIRSLDIINNNLSEDEYITIYRGLNDYNNRNVKGNSWTISYNCGEHYATRLFSDEEKGQLYKARVHIDDIITYIDNRNEFEVVVRFEDVKDVQFVKEMKKSDYTEDLNDIS